MEEMYDVHLERPNCQPLIQYLGSSGNDRLPGIGDLGPIVEETKPDSACPSSNKDGEICSNNIGVTLRTSRTDTKSPEQTKPKMYG